jgi:hypothetical protein
MEAHSLLGYDPGRASRQNLREGDLHSRTWRMKPGWNYLQSISR